MNDTIIIIARYMEDLEWIDKPPYNKYPYIVYNKGNDQNYKKTDKFIEEIKLPNVGRETHTYLYHIIENYHRISRMTIFLPGSMELKHKDIKGRKLFEQLEIEPYTTTFVCDTELKGYHVLNVHSFTLLNKYTSSSSMNSQHNEGNAMALSPMRPLGRWYLSHFDASIPNLYTTYNSIFALSRDSILAHHVPYYNGFINEVNTHHNHEVVHYYERTWYSVFYDPDIETNQVYTSFND
jgi:hypothetical protein